MYIPLHLHTTHSIGDAILEIDTLIIKMNSIGLGSAAITNHGSISDIYQFHKSFMAKNLKPILGCEFYLSNDGGQSIHHLIVIAKNLKGFHNLLFLHNYSQLEGFYTKPLINFKLLSEHSEGLIVTTACIGGELPQIILNNELDKPSKDLAIAEFVKSYSEIFEEFFLEIQPGDFLEQRIVNEALIKISEKYNVPIVVTNDVHYLNPEDYLAHNIHVAARRKTTESKNGNGLIYPDKCYYLMEEADLRERLKYIDKDVLDSAIHNTGYIDSIVETYKIIKDSISMPSYNGLSEEKAGSLIETDCFKRLEKLKDNIEDITDYVDRLYHELKVISLLKFNGYFLIVQDYLKYAKERDIETNAGRGSICSSLVAYLMGIHHVDPIKYNLLFERFLSIYRTSAPDIDCDFDASRREEIFSYVIEKYGADHCALVSTIATRKSKSAIKDVGRVYGYSQEEFDGVAKLIPAAYYIDDEDGGTEKKTDLSIQEAMEIVPKLKEYYIDHKEWFDTAIKLTNLPKTTSIHAAGTLISPLPLIETIPLIRNAKSDMLATSLNLKDAEDCSLIKFDFLSIATLTVINKVKHRVGIKDIYKAIGNCDDENVWKTIGSKNLAGLFQISSNTYKQRMWRLAPNSIEDLAACLALVRGPCISSKADERYMNILEGKEEIELVHPIYDDITWRTNGILIYQEQLMELCNQMGFSLEEGYIIMKLAAHKKMDKLKQYELKFMDLAKEKQMDKEIAIRIFKMIVDAGLYSFNESHACAYSITCYVTAYLKTYYPLEFYAASLTNAYERANDIEDYVQEIYGMGYKFLPLDINKSTWDFIVEGDAIRVGLSSVMGVGHAASIELDSIKPINSLEDFLERINRSLCNKRAIVPLCLLGTFKSLGEERQGSYEKFFELDKSKLEEEFYLQSTRQRMSIYEEDYTIEEAFMKHAYMSGTSSKLMPIGIDSFKYGKTFYIEGKILRVKKIKDKSGCNMAFLSVLTGDGSIDVTVFKNQYEIFKKELKKNLIKCFELKKQKGFILQSIREE